jgi:hypothetical protein
MGFAGTFKLHATHWCLERKLSRRTRADSAGVVFKVCAIRIYSAAACFISMLLVAWVGAFARAVSAHDWQAFRILDGTTLITVSAQAGRYQGYLLPVLLSWAVLLLLTPTGYTVAFRAAVLAAGILGYLDFSPPSFWVTARVTAMSHWFISFDDYWSRHAIPFLIFSIGAAYVLQYSAVSMFEQLDQLPIKPGRESYGESSSLDLLRKPCAMLLVLLVLLSVTWAATVIRLAASHASILSPEISYGFQGGLYQSRYLLVLAIIAACFPQIYNVENWLIAAVVLTALYGLAPNALPFPSILEISAGRGQLARIGTAWGGGSLWAALFIFTPAIIFGIYLVAKLLRSP